MLKPERSVDVVYKELLCKVSELPYSRLHASNLYGHVK